jgi:hypothetical protein
MIQKIKYLKNFMINNINNSFVLTITYEKKNIFKNAYTF